MFVNCITTMKELDYGNCGIARLRGKEAYVKDAGLRIETGYKAGMAGKLAQHSEAPGSAMQVNPEVARRNSAFLPREASSARGVGLDVPSRRRSSSSDGRIVGRGVSRGRSSRLIRAGSSCRRIIRPAKVPGGLTCGEGPKLGGGNDRRRL